MDSTVDTLVSLIKTCRICQGQLPHEPNPVFTLAQTSKILIIGQAPGAKVHQSGIPWDDLSGKELRTWLGVSDAEFYDPHNFSILPMGLCYPGKGKNGDLPPRQECSSVWHASIIENLKEVQLTILVGKYAQQYYLKQQKYTSLTDAVRNYRQYLPRFLPLPHPSPRNFIWKAKNPWFQQDVVPSLQEIVRQIIREPNPMPRTKVKKT